MCYIAGFSGLSMRSLGLVEFEKCAILYFLQIIEQQRNTLWNSFQEKR